MSKYWVAQCTVTGKKQITVPAKVYNELELEIGDKILFSCNSDTITVTAEKKVDKCIACDGTGTLSKHKCIMCEGTGIMNKEYIGNIYLLMLDLISRARQYGINISLITMNSPIPQINISGEKYNEEDIISLNDKLQLLIVKDYIRNYGISSDIKESDIVEMLISAEARNELQNFLKEYNKEN